MCEKKQKNLTLVIFTETSPRGTGQHDMVNVRRKHNDLRQLKLNCICLFSPEGLSILICLLGFLEEL